MSIPQKYETGSNDYQQGFIDCVDYLQQRLSVESMEEIMGIMTREVFISTKPTMPRLVKGGDYD